MKELLTANSGHIFILGLVAWFLAMILTPVYTYFAYKYKFWKRQREGDVNGDKLTVFSKLHKKKFEHHIPTMAGLIFVVVISAVTLIFNLDRGQTWLPLAALIGGAVVGLLDDIINLFSHGKGQAGLRPIMKLIMIVILGAVLGWWWYSKLGVDQVFVPYLGDIHLGLMIIPLFTFVVVATGNAVNISDGLDGLAGGLAAIAFLIYGMISLLHGSVSLAGFCFTVVGALLSYLWFNIFPARFFMGDVGSFALGTSLGVVAMLTNTVVILPVVAAMFVIETGSAVLQILSKKFLHRKIWPSAPIHQSFQYWGWAEPKVVMRFWMLGAVSGILGLILAMTGGMV